MPIGYRIFEILSKMSEPRVIPLTKGEYRATKFSLEVYFMNPTLLLLIKVLVASLIVGFVTASIRVDRSFLAIMLTGLSEACLGQRAGHGLRGEV